MFKKITSVLSTAYISLFTMTKGKQTGTDDFGNIYYTGKPRRGQKRERRWVIYNGKPEASKVPPEWHGWLHHQTDAVPSQNNPYRQKWQKDHLPNLTGTPNAYFPPGHGSQNKPRAKTTGDYEAWQPK